MSNFLEVSRKELLDLVYNPIMLVMLFTYLLVMAVYFVDSYDHLITRGFNSNSYAFLSGLLVIFTQYGSIVGIVLGYLSLSSEKNRGTMNVLIAKPLYRDTMINGKFLGCTVFIFCLLVLSSIVYLILGLLFMGSITGPMMFIYLEKLPVIILLSILCIMPCYSFSFLMSLLIKKDAFALFVSILFWIFMFHILPNVAFSGNLSLLFGGYSEEQDRLMDFIALLSPTSMVASIFHYNPDFNGILFDSSFHIFKLCLYVVVLVVSCYIVFLRRDIV